MKPDFTFPTEADRLKTGATEVNLNNYINELRLSNESRTIKETLGDLKTNPLGTTFKQASELAGLAKGIKASMDNSAIFRQGWKTLFTNPTTWAKNAVKSFSDIAKQVGRKPSDDSIINGIKAEIYSRPNSLNGRFKDMKLDIGNLEEAFPTTLPEKIPLFGSLYKASETAYMGFFYRMRADIADRLVDIAEKTGVDVSDRIQLESIGKLVNSLTGRGRFAPAIEGAAKEINTLFFSPKMLKSNFDFLTLHAADKMTPFARKQAATNMVKVIGGIATILGIAQAIDPDSVELDPRSADFGKIKVGDTRFDVSGGMSSLVVLASRLIKQSKKSSTTGKVTKLGGGFGQDNGMDVVSDFFQNKLSPAASVVKNLINQEDFDGNPVTFMGEAKNLLLPLPYENLYETLQEPNSANPIITTLADFLGISTNTY